MGRSSFGRISFRIALLLAVTALSAATLRAQSAASSQTIEVDANASSHPFPHFWEKRFGSERGIVTLRESYRHDLRETKRITGFEYVRFHAIFHDETDFYDEDK